MQEYITDAIVLRRDPVGDSDLRISLLTKKFGKMVVRAKSARKITSKLSPHLLPAFLVKVRIIEKNGIQIVDAIKTGKTAIDPGDLIALDKILQDSDLEPKLWPIISGGNIRWNDILTILGWDYRVAACHVCSGSPLVFFIPTQDFFCNNCSLGFPENGVIYIRNQN